MKRILKFPILLITTILLCLYSGCQEPLAKKEMVYYSEFGAIGDGKADDIEALIQAHAHANTHGLAVKADDNATYYLGGLDKTIVIQTDTDWGTAKFIIDDRALENIKSPVIEIKSKQSPIEPQGICSLKKNQTTIPVSFPGPYMVKVTNKHVKNYIRKGNNQNSGSSLTDIFIVDSEGSVDKSSPILWDFDQITKVIAFPIDETSLTINGGRFTTIANTAESKYNYHSRGISIQRSNVIVNDLEHRIEGEGDQGAPYIGFLMVRDCSNVTVKDSGFSGHKTYQTIGNAGKPVSMGSYDLSVSSSISVSFINCRQLNDFKDTKLWGIMASNYSKNLLYDGCTLSRFDAHKGVYNSTLRNSTLRLINIIGEGEMILKNVKVYNRTFLNFRSDYGSTWTGELTIQDCEFFPPNQNGT